MMRTAWAALGAALFFGVSFSAAADINEDQALTELVQILHKEGVLDEGQLNQLSAKAAKAEAKSSWTDRISLWGDFRGRYEGFFYVEDDKDVDDRSRLRYRMRLNGKAEINSRASVLFRLASGSLDDRSTNATLGGSPDFAMDQIWLDRAYVRISPFEQGLLPGEAGTLWAEFGRLPNPFVGKIGKDFMLWDNDINLEGMSFLFENDLTDDINLYANAGYYVVQELKDMGDPNLLAAQLGGTINLGEDIVLGGRTSYFRFGNVSMDEIQRGVDGTGGVTSAGGNIVDGIVSHRNADVIEGRVYSQFNCFEDWPIMVYGTISSNLSAQSSELFPQAGKEDLAWGVGAEVGDKKKYVQLGLGWFAIEANAFFSQFIDSDLFDGKTNRKGLVAYASRQILPNTELSVTTFWSRPIDDSLPAFENSVPKADRVRVQADLNFKF